ncbi:MAG: glycosyl hydrolase [Caldilineaceae bacterium]
MFRYLALSVCAGACALLLLVFVRQPAGAQAPGAIDPGVVAPTAPQPGAVDQQGAVGRTADWTSDRPVSIGQQVDISTTASVYWGAYIHGGPYGVENAPWDTRAIDFFEASAGKQVSVLHWGQAWQRCGTTCIYQEFQEQKPQFDAMWQRGIVPLLDWGSWSTTVSPRYIQPNFALSTIIDGSHDAYIQRWAKAAKEWGHPVFLRFNWEMNGNWYPWSETRNGNSSGQYVTSWRHVREIFRAEGATNVKWVWCPNVIDTRSTVPLSHYYPGGDYVDWLCIDGYNWGTNPARPDRWKTFAEVFGLTYKTLTQISSRPIMIAETGSSEIGGSKAAWISDTLEVALPYKFPRIRAFVWFNWNADRMDWIIESSPSAQAAFAKGIASPYYRPGEFGAIISAEDQVLTPQVVACPDDQCVYLPAIATD